MKEAIKQLRSQNFFLKLFGIQVNKSSTQRSILHLLSLFGIHEYKYIGIRCKTIISFLILYFEPKKKNPEQTKILKLHLLNIDSEWSFWLAFWAGTNLHFWIWILKEWPQNCPTFVAIILYLLQLGENPRAPSHNSPNTNHGIQMDLPANQPTTIKLESTWSVEKRKKRKGEVGIVRQRIWCNIAINNDFHMLPNITNLIINR